DVSAEGVIEDAHQVDIDDRALPSSQQAPAARAAERDERTHLIWLVCGSKSVCRRCRRRPGSGRLCVRSGGAGGGTGQPGHGALDLPPVPAQPLRVLHTLAGQAMDDPAFTEPAAQVVVVIALVAVQLGRTTSPWAAPGPDRPDPAHPRLPGLACEGVGRWDRHGQGQTGLVGDQVYLRPFLTPVDRIRTC